MRVKARDRYRWSAVSLVLLLGSIAWIAASPSWMSIVWGGVLIVLLAWIWATMLVAKRLGGGVPHQLVVTRQAISSPFWSLRWDRVRGVWIGHTPAGSLRALFIEPLQASDVELPSSRLLRLNRMLSERGHSAALTILEANIDRSVEQLMLDLERQTKRELRVLTPEG